MLNQQRTIFDFVRPYNLRQNKFHLKEKGDKKTTVSALI